MSKVELNALLAELLGSEDLISRWWHSPNRHWDNRTPYDVWREQPKAVENYILSFCCGEHS